MASIEDFDDAKALYKEKAQNQGTKLTAVELKLCRTLHELHVNGMEDCDSTTLERNMNMSQQRIHKLIHGIKNKPESGLLHKVKGLHVEKKTVQLTDTSRTTKNYYSLDNFDALGSYGDVVDLPERNRSDYSHYNHYNHTTTQTTTDNIDNSIQTTTTTTLKEKEHIRVIKEESEKNNPLSEKQKNGCSGCSQPAVTDNQCCSASDSGCSQPAVTDNQCCSQEKNIQKQQAETCCSGVFKACEEWEKQHHEKINSTNLTKVCFALKPMFPDINMDDLADMIRKSTKITSTNSNGDSEKPPLKKGKEIEIPFNDWSLDRLKAGKKTATSRTKKYGNPGDLFRVGDGEYVLTAITEKPLKEIAEHYFKAEGAESSDEFIEVWRSIHRKKGFVPDQIVFYHEFANISTNGNGSEDSDPKNVQHPCSSCGAIPAKNTSESSLKQKEYYCVPCYKNLCEKRGAKI